MPAVVRRLLVAFLLALALVAPLIRPRPVSAALDPAVRDGVIPAAVQIGVLVTVTENGQTSNSYVTFGSGTVVSTAGLVLTNQHVVAASTDAELRRFEAEQQATSPGITFTRQGEGFAILTTDGRQPTELRYLASLVAEDAALDLAVLRIDRDPQGAILVGSTLNLPFVPLGDSDQLDLGDDLHVFGYPVIGGRAMTYAPGVVSGFRYEDGVDGPAWIVSNVLISGGDSGGTAVDDAGRLVGVPTAGTPLDCRPGDTNADGTVDANDTGCVPTGGSLAQIRPINLARPLLAQADPAFAAGAAPASTAPTNGDAADPRAAADRCVAAGDWLCATRFLERALAAAPGDPALTHSLVDAYLQRGASEEGAGRLTDARASYQRAAELDPSRAEAQAALDRIGGYGSVVFQDDFSGPQRFTPSDAGDASAAYVDGGFVLTESAPGGLFSYPLGDHSGNSSAAVDLRGAEGDGSVLIQVSGEGDGAAAWIFGVDPLKKRWTAMQVDPGADTYHTTIAPTDFGALVADPVSRVELRVVDGAPQLLVNHVDVPAAQAVALPAVDGARFSFGVAMDPDGTAPFKATFDAVALYALN